MSPDNCKLTEPVPPPSPALVRRVREQGVGGSNPLTPTIFFLVRFQRNSPTPCSGHGAFHFGSPVLLRGWAPLSLFHLASRRRLRAGPSPTEVARHFSCVSTGCVRLLSLFPSPQASPVRGFSSGPSPARTSQRQVFERPGLSMRRQRLPQSTD